MHFGKIPSIYINRIILISESNRKINLDWTRIINPAQLSRLISKEITEKS